MSFLKKNDIFRFAVQLMVLLFLGLLVSFLTSCKKDNGGSVTYNILGAWDVADYGVYLPDTVIKEWNYKHWDFKDNGYVIIVVNSGDTGYYTYDLSDSLKIFDKNDNVRYSFSVSLSKNDMEWNEVINYDPLEDFTSERIVRLERAND